MTQVGRVGRVVAVPAAILIVQAVVWPMPTGVYVMGGILGLLGALVAVGMVLINRANRIVNFAQSALGLIPTVLAVELIVYSRVAYSYAALIGLAAAALLGMAVSGLIIRRFAHASRLVLTAATIGLAQLCLGGSLLLPRLWGHPTRAESISVPWHWNFRIAPLEFHAAHVVAIVVGLVSLGAVAFVLLRTRLGAAVRASADSADRAELLGIPVQRLNLVIWASASMLSFVGMFLRVSILGLPAATLDSQTALLAALAALALGRFDRIGTVALVAVTLGVLEQAIVWNHPENPELYAVVLAVLTLVALVAYVEPVGRLARDLTSSWKVLDEPRPLPTALRRNPAVRAARIGLPLLVLVGGVAVPGVLDAGGLLKASTVLVFAIIGTSLVVLIGWAGQVSLGQMGFVAVGAAVGATATTRWQWDLAPTLVAAGLAAAVVAVVVGLPALRLRGMFLAVTTLAFGVATSVYLLNPRYATWLPQGRVQRTRFAWVFDVTGERGMYRLCLAAFVLTYLAARAIRSGRTGRIMVAQRDNETAAASFGVSNATARLGAFAISGSMAGVAGCLLTVLIQSFPSQLVTPDESIAAFISTIVGGIATPAGGLIGSLVSNGSAWYLSGPARYLSTAVGVLVVLLVVPSGVGGALLKLRNRVLRIGRGADDEAAVAPVTATDVTSPPPTSNGDDRSRPVALEVGGLRVRFGDVAVVDDVDVSVRDGDTLALLGTNGAGKSTILNTVAGLVAPAAGTVRLHGRDITGRPAHDVARLGLAVCPGGKGVFPSLTVEENLHLAAWLRRDGYEGRTAEVLEMFPVLSERRHTVVANLSGGEQQMLALGMAWIQGPSVLCIDELSLGLAPIVVEALLAFLDLLRTKGVTIVVVEQSINLALAITDDAVFLERGRIRFHGRTDSLIDQPELYRAIHLDPGSTIAERPAETRPHRDLADSMALQAAGVSAHYGGISAVSDVDIEVPHGSVIGLIGANGAGKSTLLDVLSGVHPPSSGRIELGGADVTAWSLASRAHAGLGRSFQDARLFSGLGVVETLAVAAEGTLAVRGVAEALLRTPAYRASEQALASRIDELLEMFGLTGQRDRTVGELSTGQRHVLDLACGVAAGAKVLLLDEPSSGLAQAEVEALGSVLPRIRDAADVSIVLVEHDVAFVSRVADRLVAMDQGTVIATGTPAEVLAHPRVQESYLGGSVTAVRRSR